MVEGTLAVELIGEVDAGGSRRASGWGAVHDVSFAVLAFVAWRALALIPWSVVHTRGAVLTHSFGTGIVLVLTTDASVILGASTVKT